MMTIIGRKREQEELARLESSPVSEFVMVYGRRRVGKTYLVREYFQNHFTFSMTGIAHGSRKEQLMNFRSAVLNYDEQLSNHTPENWMEAFGLLSRLLEQSHHPRKIVFLDELPWIDTPKSDFVKALEHFWNSWASARRDVLLIVCGSAASWLVKNIVNNHGGLHNRLTCKIKLLPFTLSETESFLSFKGIRWPRRLIAECYMILGGIPYYLSLLDKGKSLAQNVDRLFFGDAPLLEGEFMNLYASLFRNSDEYVRIVEVLSKKKSGYSRDEILRVAKMTDGGSFSRKLEELEQCGFIRSFRASGEVQKMYQLSDFFSLFYFDFVHKGPSFDSDFWMHISSTPSYHTWCGLAFERLCMWHLPQIKRALGISGVSTNTYSYYSRTAQIDMVIERGDRIVNLCEMKFSDQPFSISRTYAEKLENKISLFRHSFRKASGVYLVMIASSGLVNNQHSINLVQNTLTLDDLF